MRMVFEQDGIHPWRDRAFNGAGKAFLTTRAHNAPAPRPGLGQERATYA